MRASVGRRTRGRAVLAAMLASVLIGCMRRVEGGGSAAQNAGSRAAAALSRTPSDVVRHDASVSDAGVRQPSDAGLDAVASRRRRRVVEEPAGLFDPRADEAILRVLSEEDIVNVERGRGGRSLAFRVTFASGARGYFKPEQTFSGTHWYAEIAAFHLDRALDARRTAPSVGRTLPWALLEPAARGDARVEEIVISVDGMVRGAMIAWIGERLVPLAPPPGWQDDLSITPWRGPDLFVPLRALRGVAVVLDGGRPDGGVAEGGLGEGELTSGPDGGADGGAETNGTADAGGGASGGPEWDAEARAAELSDLVVFDYLIHNADRWGGNFTNVRTRAEGGPLVYLDNAAGFSPRRARLTVMDLRLERVERFRASTLRALERFEVEEYAARLARDPLAPILEPRQLEHLEERRLAAIARIERSIADHGRDRALPW